MLSLWSLHTVHLKTKNSVAPLPEALVCHQMAYTKQDSCWTREHLVQIECHLAFKVRLIMAM